MRFIFTGILFFISTCIFSANRISILYDKNLDTNTCIHLCLQDLEQLFVQTKGIHFSFHDDSADIQWILPGKKDITNHQEENFAWIKSQQGNTWTLTLKAASPKAIANGLYAMMQETMGYKFYHPRETLIPDLTHFNPESFISFEGKILFPNIGFHLHTMHPTELTEDLLDHTIPGNTERVKEYINWLARNGQTYFEFNVLESIDPEPWVLYAKTISNYAHQRGISCGLDLSLHMLQQKAFQLYNTPPFTFVSIEKQVIKNTELMVKAGFDVWNVELSATEFTPGNQEKKTRILALLTSLLDAHQVKLMSRNHVVKPEEMLDGKASQGAGHILSPKQGLMVHTVMFYSLTDEKAPVYRNKNLRHMYTILQEEKEKRETWYFPESAYWVTFDLSVPMLLLPYLQARLEDIETCKKENIDGHLTFSSGWEWGYWLIDWSIARWCWDIKKEGKIQPKNSLQYVNEISQDPVFKNYVAEEEKLQQFYIKEQELIRVMVAQTITDEIPGPFNLEFHPRPVYPYPYMRNKASLAELDTIRKKYLVPLSLYQKETDRIDSMIREKTFTPLEQEIVDGILITHLRARHKQLTVEYLVQHRENILRKKHSLVQPLLDEAKNIRLKGVKIVERREKNYRYDVTLLTTKRYDHTCYHFGYLFPVHALHFWEREEQQALHNRYQFWYKSIWHVPRTVGMVD